MSVNDTEVNALAGLLPRPAVIRSQRDGALPVGRAVVEHAGVPSGVVEAACMRTFASGPEMPVRIVVANDDEAVPYLGADESYAVSVGKDGIVIDARSQWGALQAVTALRQLAIAGKLSWCEIADRPRFAWRGLMLDPARRFLDMGTILRVVDAMGLFRLNVLHLHLTDDQGFRFDCASLPQLASADHYSADQLRDLVAFATARGVRVVPELDMPGHVTCWLAAYPELGVAPVDASQTFGPHPGCLDPSQPAVYDAIGRVLTTIAEIFPDRYIHIGGDEVADDALLASAQVRAFMAQQGYGAARDVQAHFNARVATLVRSRNRIAIGWDEMVHEAVPSDLAIVSWRGATARDRAVNAGHDCVVAAGDYLDLNYPADLHWGFVPDERASDLVAQEDAWRDDLRLRHVADGLRWTDQWRDVPGPTRKVRGRVLGGQACLWGELADARTLEIRLWSRMPIIAEKYWSVDQPGIEQTNERLRHAWRLLEHCCDIDLENRQRALLAAAGLDAGQCEVVVLLEPVRWYARLLGEVALAARLSGETMPQARPYHAGTALDKPVDALFPESPQARELAQLDDASLLARCDGLRRTIESGEWSQELAGAIGLLDRVLEQVQAYLLGRADVDDACAALDACYRPEGEYLVGLVPPLIERFSRV